MEVAILTSILVYEKRLLHRCINHLKSDLINNMDHMCITGTDPHKWSLAKQGSSNVEKWCPKSAKYYKKSSNTISIFLFLIPKHVPVRISTKTCICQQTKNNNSSVLFHWEKNKRVVRKTTNTWMNRPWCFM